MYISNIDVVKKDILDLNPSFTSAKRITKTNDVLKNVRAQSGIDPKDDNVINLLPMSIGNIEYGSVHRIRN